ncbi:MAG: methyltransferase domain-containing protein [Clostridia bacterium]|jgi:tRNA (cmo5U34)-methyltransferase
MLNRLKEKHTYRNLKIIQADYFEYPFEKEKFDAALSFETLHHFKFKKKQEIYRKLKESLYDGGSYIECDYIACCIEEEEMCLREYEDRRKINNVPDDIFVHIDIPLTMEHQIGLMQNAGFRKVQAVYQNESTVIFKADK